MRTLRYCASIALLAIGLTSFASTGQSTHASREAPTSAAAADVHDFDFLVGEWRVRHRRLKERLANSHEWLQFEGTLSNRSLMQGTANVGDNWFDMPAGAYRGVGFRAYDPKTRQWASWWLDGRDPFALLDPPSKGTFEQGVGTFYADSTFKGKPIRVRVVWSRITPVSARWEQSFSVDSGRTWELNWISEFERVNEPRR